MSNGKQHPSSYMLPAYTRAPAKPKLRSQIDHSKRPHHDRFGREIPPWKPEDDEPPRNERGEPICYAHLRGGKPGPYGDNRCHSPKLMANGRCRIHGGKSLVGPDSPRYKHGKYGRRLPDRLQEYFIESIHDPDKMALDAEMSLIETRINELVSQIDASASEEKWETARQHSRDLWHALNRQDTRGVLESAKALREVLDSGIADFATWDAIGRMVDRKRKLAETETKRVQLAQETMTAAQTQAWIQAIGTILRDRIKDPVLLSQISYDFAKLSGPTAGDRHQSDD